MRFGGGSWDHRVLHWVDAHRTAPANAVARHVLVVGTTTRYLVLAGLVALVLALWLRAYRPALAAAAAFVIAATASGLLKQAFDRPRPPRALSMIHVGGASFPSTHAAVTSAVAVAVLVSVAWPSARAAFAAWSVALAALLFEGILLVYLGSHWPTDVVGGWLLGGAVGTGCGWLARLPEPWTPAWPRLPGRPAARLAQRKSLPAPSTQIRLTAGSGQPRSRLGGRRATMIDP